MYCSWTTSHRSSDGAEQGQRNPESQVTRNKQMKRYLDKNPTICFLPNSGVLIHSNFLFSVQMLVIRNTISLCEYLICMYLYCLYLLFFAIIC